MKFIHRYYTILVVLIFILGIVLRAYNYYSFPVYGETADEIAWTWLGASLLKTGAPASWSYFSEYDPEYIIEENSTVGAPMVRPALDHPPLFGLVPGIFHVLRAEWNEHPSSKVIRFPMVALSIINLFLFLLVSQRYFANNRSIQLVSLALFATIPSIVWSSRLVVSENLLLTLLLLQVLAILVVKTHPKIALVGLAITSMLAPLTKIAGLAISVTTICFAKINRQKKLFAQSLLALAFGLLLFLGYVSVFNAPLFFEVQLGQSDRDVGLTTLYTRFFIHPSFVQRTYIDAWLILGLLCFFCSFFIESKNHGKQYLHIFSLVYLAYIVFSVGERTVHGWYTIPLLPVFVLSISEVFEWIRQKQAYLLSAVLWLFALPVFRMIPLFFFDSFVFSKAIFRAILFFGFLPFLLSLFENRKPIIPRVLLVTTLLLLLVANVVTIFAINQELYWYASDFYKELP